MRHRYSTYALTLLLAGCKAVGPDFVAPDAATPSSWKRASATASASAALAASGASGGSGANAEAATAAAALLDPRADPDPRWWRSFNDPTLDALEARAVSGNLDLQEAVLRIAASRSQEQIARAAGLPSVNATGSYTREQLGLEGLLREQGAYSGINQLGAPGSALNQFSPGLGTQAAQGGRGLLDGLTSPTNLYQVGFDASWELDLFGRVRRSVESAKAQNEADIEQRNDALVSLEAEVARTYAQLRGAQTAERVTRELIDAEQGILDLTQSQQRSGLASDIDVQAAQVQVAISQAQLPQFEQQIAQAMNALSVLVGEAPGTLDAELLAAGPNAEIPPVPPSVPIGLPGSLARRRPDIRRAEANLHAATAEVGVATAQLFPDISLTGSFGYRTTQAKNIGNWANHFYSFGPSVSLPIFQGGQIVANIRMTKAEQATAAIDYRKTVLNALADVENALAAYQSEHDRRLALARSAAAAQKSLDISQNGYRHGLTSFINVLDAQRTLAQNRQALVQSMLTETSNLVSVYKALGGGWQDADTGTLPVGTLGNAGFKPAGFKPASVKPASIKPAGVGPS